MKHLNKLVISAILLSASMPSMAKVGETAGNLSGNDSPFLVARPAKTVSPQMKLPTFGDPNELITDAPAGELKRYVREGYYWYPYYSYMMFDHKSNTCAEIVEGEDGFVYIKNPYTNFVSNSYLKGKRDGDKITVSLPQPIYREPNMTEPGKFNTYYAVIMMEEYAGSDYYIATDDTEVTYTIEGDKISLDLGYIPQQDPWGGWEYPYYILGLVTDEGIWMSEGEAAQTWVPFTGEPIEVPAGLEFQDWGMSYKDGGQFVKVGFDGNDVYIKGMLPDLPEGVFKGSIEGDKVVFKSGQYIGIYKSNTYAFMVGVKYDENNKTSISDELIFSYDKEQKKISAEENSGVAYSKEADALSVIKLWKAPSFCLQPADIDQTPLAPTVIEYEAYSEEKNQGFFRFDLPIYNKDGYVLNDKNMYYNIYFDGALETFYTDEYKRLEEDMTDIPYTFGEGWNFYALGTVHVVYYYSRGVNTVGFKLCNKVDGVVYSSPITTLDLASGNVTSDVNLSYADGQPIAEEWYTMGGMRISTPGVGIYIKKTLFDNGNTKVEKVAVSK